MIIDYTKNVHLFLHQLLLLLLSYGIVNTAAQVYVRFWSGRGGVQILKMIVQIHKN